MRSLWTSLERGEVARGRFWSLELGAEKDNQLEASRVQTVAVILVGDELLTGKTADKNGALLIGELRALGADLRSVTMIADDVSAIAEAVSREASRVDVVITSGGVGPTHDDMTMRGVARAFGVGLESNKVVEETEKRAPHCHRHCYRTMRRSIKRDTTSS